MGYSDFSVHPNKVRAKTPRRGLGLLLVLGLSLAGCGDSSERSPESVADDLSDLVYKSVTLRKDPAIEADKGWEPIERTDRFTVQYIETFMFSPPYWDIRLDKWDCRTEDSAEQCADGRGTPVGYSIEPNLVDPRSIRIIAPDTARGEVGHALKFECAAAGDASCLRARGIRHDDDEYDSCENNDCSDMKRNAQEAVHASMVDFARNRAASKSMTIECGTAETCSEALLLFRELLDRAAMRPHITDANQIKDQIAIINGVIAGADFEEHFPKGRLHASANGIESVKRIHRQATSFGMNREGLPQLSVEVCAENDPGKCDDKQNWDSLLMVVDIENINPARSIYHDWKNQKEGGEIVTEWEGKSLVLACHAPEVCIEEFGVGISFRSQTGTIPCKDAETCYTALWSIMSLVSFAATPAYDDFVAEMMAKAHPVTEIDDWDDAEDALKRIADRLREEPWRVPISDIDLTYLIHQRDAEFDTDNSILITGYFCVEGEQCGDEDKEMFADMAFALDLMDSETLRTDRLVALKEQKILNIACAGEENYCAGLVLPVGLWEMRGASVTCKNSDACEATAADLRGLKAFLGNAPPRESDQTDKADDQSDEAAKPKPVDDQTLDPAIVGIWALENPPFTGWVTEFRADGKFIFNNGQGLTMGAYTASGGVMYQTTPSLNLTETVTYRFLDNGRIELTGRYGVSIWRRQGVRR